jgi:hypothetical protein
MQKNYSEYLRKLEFIHAVSGPIGTVSPAR